MSVPAQRMAEQAATTLSTTAAAVANEDAFVGTRANYQIVGEFRRVVVPKPATENERRTELRELTPTEVSNQAVPQQPRPVVLHGLAGSPSAVLAGPPSAVLEVRQQWEGTVESVSDTDIVARLRDLTTAGNPDERATFSRDEIADADQGLVAPGAVFYWSIGYERTVFGQKSAKSSIRFRRLPAWTKSEVAAVHREADELARALGLDE